MQIPPFELERWQSVWENVVELNITESGVKPMTVHELVDDAAALEAILNVPLGYPQSNGCEELRVHVATLYPGAHPENVLMACGTAEANFLVAWSLLSPGDEVIFVQPNYMQIAGVAKACGATVKILWLREELGWMPDLNELKKLVTPRTKLIAVCNPNNPTGSVMTPDVMDGICKIAAGCGAWLLADEVYRGAEFEPGLSPTFWGRYDRVICTAGLSKSYGLPGLRLGWVVAPQEKVMELWGAKDYTTIGITMLTERLGVYALEPERRQRISARTREILNKNYPAVKDWVQRHSDSLRHIAPKAGAIAWIGYKNPRPSEEIAEELRADKNLLIVPGTHFAMEGFLRIGFGYDADKLAQALQRVESVMFNPVSA